MSSNLHRSMKNQIAVFLAAQVLGISLASCSQPSSETDVTDPGTSDGTMSDDGDKGSGDDGGGDGSGDETGVDEGGGGTTGSGTLPDVTPAPGQPEVMGTETPVSDKYWPRGVDLGVVDPDAKFRAVLTFPIRNQAELMARVDSLYDPSSSGFRSYLTASDAVTRYAPTDSDFNDVKTWLTSQGFKVDRVARNRLMLQYSGTVRQFNAAFATELHEIKRSPDTWRAPAYAPIKPLEVPAALIGKVKRVLMPDPEAESGTLNADVAPIVTTMPAGVADNLTPAQITKAYGISELYAQGYKGAGVTIGVVGATLFKNSDAQSMWQTFGITRKNPTVVQTMEPIITRDLETTLDIQLAGAIAPEAEIIYYGGPDNSDTTLLYTFNEAVGAAQVQVISDSFAHAEATTPYPVARAYNESAMLAAVMGITVVSASGDSVQVDVPSNSPYVTAVGGTNVELNADSSWKSEQSWGLAGCGRSRLFTLPTWQSGAFAEAKGRRTVADVGVVVGPYWVKYLGKWTYADGTSASTPVFAGVVALIDQYRKAKGKPPVGFLNPVIYKHAATRSAFRDITQVGYGGCATGPGYDLATGIGSPKAAELAAAFP